MRGKEELTPVEKLFWCTFHVVGWFWNVFSFYPWYIFSGNYKKNRLGHQQGKSTTGKPEGPYRSIEAIGGLTSNWKGLKTLDQIFKYVYSALFLYVFLKLFVPLGFESRSQKGQLMCFWFSLIYLFLLPWFFLLDQKLSSKFWILPLSALASRHWNKLLLTV